MRIAGILTAVLVLSLAVAGMVSAQGPPPTVTVTTNGTTLTVTPGGTLAPGQTRFEFVRAGGGQPELFVAALRAGVTIDQFTAALRADPEGGKALELAYLDGGASLDAALPRRFATFALRANTTYVAMNIEGENPSGWEFTTFTVGGTPNGAAAPSADATVNFVDLRFTGDRTLPRNGTIRFRNRGWAPHFALAAPVRAGVSSSQVGRALRSGSDRTMGRALDFQRVIEPQALITRGADVVNEVRFPRAGRYALICFFEGHAAQGMYRVVRVR
ncbi:MAG: hypothetical protein QOG77_3746 [Solirubrobacteraceae bacterium]|nr:hypothetical protein [Solirubrobacteraceae bacterium]